MATKTKAATGSAGERARQQKLAELERVREEVANYLDNAQRQLGHASPRRAAASLWIAAHAITALKERIQRDSLQIGLP